jgi:hypothetical protein
MPNLPMYQKQLENFIYHHIHEWAKYSLAENIVVYPDMTLYDSMDNEFRTFMQDLEQRFIDEIKPKFGDV